MTWLAVGSEARVQDAESGLAARSRPQPLRPVAGFAGAIEPAVGDTSREATRRVLGHRSVPAGMGKIAETLAHGDTPAERMSAPSVGARSPWEFAAAPQTSLHVGQAVRGPWGVIPGRRTPQHARPEDRRPRRLRAPQCRRHRPGDRGPLILRSRPHPSRTPGMSGEHRRRHRWQRLWALPVRQQALYEVSASQRACSAWEPPSASWVSASPARGKSATEAPGDARGALPDGSPGHVW